VHTKKTVEKSRRTGKKGGDAIRCGQWKSIAKRVPATVIGGRVGVMDVTGSAIGGGELRGACRRKRIAKIAKRERKKRRGEIIKSAWTGKDEQFIVREEKLGVCSCRNRKTKKHGWGFLVGGGVGGNRCNYKGRGEGGGPPGY